MCVKRYTPDNLQKVQISNQNSDCIHFSLCHWTRLMWLRLLLLLLLRNARSFLCHEWTNLRGHIFFSPPLTHSSALLHSSHTHATITSYDLCFLRLIYHCIAPNCLSSLGELHWAPSRTWRASDERKNTLRSHQPYSKQQQGQGKLSLCAKARKTLNLKKKKKKIAQISPDTSHTSSRSTGRPTNFSCTSCTVTHIWQSRSSCHPIPSAFSWLPLPP